MGWGSIPCGKDLLWSQPCALHPVSSVCVAQVPELQDTLLPHCAQGGEAFVPGTLGPFHCK